MLCGSLDLEFWHLLNETLVHIMFLALCALHPIQLHPYLWLMSYSFCHGIILFFTSFEKDFVMWVRLLPNCMGFFGESEGRSAMCIPFVLSVVRGYNWTWIWKWPAWVDCYTSIRLELLVLNKLWCICVLLWRILHPRWIRCD